MNLFSQLGGGLALGTLFGVIATGHLNDTTFPVTTIAAVLQGIGIFGLLFERGR